MPRDGSNIYHRPPGTDGIPNYTIESAKYNANVADVEQDLNLPRPIVAGGTGANNAADAMSNLGGEGSKIEVTNYASHNFTAGSFYSKSTATGGPIDGHAFAGICYVAVVSGVATSDMFIEVRDRDEVTQPGSLYVRQKKAGTWSGWLKAVGATASATPPPTPADNTLWWDPTRGKLFIRYTDVDTSQWVETVAMPDMNPDDFVRIDASQNLTAAQQTQARKNIFAAPFDALAYNGMQVNGAAEVSQELGLDSVGTAISTGGAYFCDGWCSYRTGSMAGYVQANSAAASIFPGIVNHIASGITTAQASLGAGDFTVFFQPIEGYRIKRLSWGTASAQPITVSFWSAHARPGVYTGTIRNAGASRSYAFSYTQNAANVGEFKTITIPGCTDSGWSITNGVGMYLTFAMASGTTQQAPSNGTWLAGNYMAGAGQINGVAATSDVFRLTGVVVLPGTEAPAAARSALIMRPYDQELLTCRRYFQTSYSSSVAVGTVSLAGSGNYYLDGLSSAVHAIFTCVPFGVPMRAAPSLYMYSPQTGAAGKIRDNGNAADVTGSPTNQGTSGFTFSAGAAAASTAANFMWHYVADARL